MLEINYLAVVVASLVSFVIGMVWYTPLTFGNVWMKEEGLKEGDVSKKAQVRGFLISFITAIIQAFGIAILINLLQADSFLQGLLTGAAASILFVATSIGMNYAYEQRTMRLFFINAGYSVIYFSATGAILALWK